ncbi:dihydrodipicolinate synthase family protein [Paraburkholderia phosphatilytica]|uniref:dihydrodipicolinate synthase family protein n=1 Tax=Paraburkholderia phosphatilytica TaxID=2282883 RepID=UPI000E531002|nr:dihydrodipicolinate synthase family protein [Paraburkholderia phosphatilytica]
MALQSSNGEGAYAAVATPLDAENRVNVLLLARHSHDLIRRGLTGITLFGTTGEGPSFTVDERRATLDGLLAAGIEPHQLIVAAGAAALGDTIELTRHALAQGCNRVLVLPPFFFRDVSGAGVADAVGAVIDALDDPRLRVILYHIPQVSGIAIDDVAISTLRERYGEIIDGIKDSSGDLEHSLGLIERHRGLKVYVGAENAIARARAAGGAGTICGLANVVPEAILASYAGGSNESREVIDTLLASVSGQPFMPWLKALLAVRQRDDGWRRVRRPLVEAGPDALKALPRALLEA